MRPIVLIAHNLRSTHNVGSLLRTAEGLGIKKVYLTGYTPYPLQNPDERLPHIAAKLDAQIHKTALDAERFISWQHSENIIDTLDKLRQAKYTLVGLEQTVDAVDLSGYVAPDKIALVVGREVEGIESEVLALLDAVVQIPMFGKKESFNVVQAAAMALYHCRFA